MLEIRIDRAHEAVNLDRLVVDGHRLVDQRRNFLRRKREMAFQNRGDTLPFRLLAQDPDALDRMIGKNDAVLVTDSVGQILWAKNTDKNLIPASILKIFTSTVALHYLGNDYRFPTEFYLDEQSNLKIKGYGDPLLVSEVIIKISQVLEQI